MSFSVDCDSPDKFIANDSSGTESPWNALRNGFRKSAFLPYKPSVTVLTNLQRGNTEAHTPVTEAEELNFHQKAAQGDLTIKDIEQEPDIDAVDDKGLTPLMWASAYGQYPIVEALLQSFAKVDLENPRGQTALLFAAYGGYHEVVRLLISNGADVNHRDESGNTALIYAATGNNPHTTNELLSRSADFSLLNKYGDSAYIVAVKKENYVAFLQRITELEHKTSLCEVKGTIKKSTIKISVVFMGCHIDLCSASDRKSSGGSSHRQQLTNWQSHF